MKLWHQVGGPDIQGDASRDRKTHTRQWFDPRGQDDTHNRGRPQRRSGQPGGATRRTRRQKHGRDRQAFGDLVQRHRAKDDRFLYSIKIDGFQDINDFYIN